MDRYDWRREVDREIAIQAAKAKGDTMKFEVIIHEDGIFVPQANGLHKLVPDAELGATLRAMSNGATPKKPRKGRGPNKRKALGKGIAETSPA